MEKEVGSAGEREEERDDRLEEDKEDEKEEEKEGMGWSIMRNKLAWDEREDKEREEGEEEGEEGERSEARFAPSLSSSNSIPTLINTVIAHATATTVHSSMTSIDPRKAKYLTMVEYDQPILRREWNKRHIPTPMRKKKPNVR